MLRSIIYQHRSIFRSARSSVAPVAVRSATHVFLRVDTNPNNNIAMLGTLENV